MKYVDIFVVGSANSCRATWAVLLRYKGKDKLKSGRLEESNIIRATMTAIIEGLKSLKEPCNVTVYTELDFIPKTFELGWNRQKNRDLWELIDEYSAPHTVKYKWFGKIKNTVMKGGDSL